MSDGANMSGAFDFSGKVLVLTGAAGSIGAAIAREYLALGGSCVLTDLSQAALDGVAKDLGAPERILTVQHDVTSPEAANAVVAAAIARFGRIDHLVTGAGLYRDASVATMSDAEWRQSIAINLDGVFYCCRAAAANLKPGGAIVNIASLAGQRGSKDHGHYAAAKGGVLSLSRTLAWELAPDIRVNAISPGLIEGPMVQPLLAARGPALMAQTPLGRLGTAQEVAKATLFLLSDWASFITGESLQVNGGLYMT